MSTVAAPAKQVGAFDIWNAFTPTQRRNIALYAFGIMCYKFALEYWNGSIVTMANQRFVGREYTSIALLTGLNYAAQCLGSIMVAPLIKRFPTRSVLATAVLTFGLIATVPLIADAATGGKMRYKTPDGKDKYGSWNINGIYPIYIISGISYGVVELIRRVIPRDIVGGDVVRLRRMDALVHVLYEIAGTAGAFSSTALIAKFGYNYSAFLSPVLFTFAAIIWTFVSALGESRAAERQQYEKEGKLAEFEASLNRPVLQQVGDAFKSFFTAFWYGGYLVTSSSKFIWLLPGYTLALYGHRYLENGLAPIVAKQLLGNSSYSQIIVGGSNFGELLGALSVMLFTNVIKTPLPWLRLDALMLQLVWVLPFFPYVKGSVQSAFTVAALMIPVSFGWAAGDCSLAAYIQAMLSRVNAKGPGSDRVSALGSVMAFLYVTYIILYAVIGSVLGNWVDSRLKGLSGDALAAAARDALKYVGGVHFTVLCAVIVAATFIPKGSFAFNPSVLDGIDLEAEPEEDVERNVDAEYEDSIDKKSSLDQSGPEVLSKVDTKANAVQAAQQ